jgi:hypothetical protein
VPLWHGGLHFKQNNSQTISINSYFRISTYKSTIMISILDAGWKKLLDMYYTVTVSDEFIRCANSQLITCFEKETGIKITSSIQIAWEYGEEFVYNKSETSSINCWLQVGHRKEAVTFFWKSASGHIYDIADSNIDCADITFWFEGLNPVLYKKILFPPMTLLRHSDTVAGMFQKDCDLNFSEEFLIVADIQLTTVFEKTVGYKVNKHVSISIIGKDDSRFVYEKGPVSKLSINIYNNHNWNFVLIRWQSKSGRVYDVGDTDIDSNDIEFWIEGIDAAMYHRQMYPKATLPFKLKDLSYELVVTRLNTDCTFTAIVKPEAVNNREAIGKELTDFIESFNLASEANNRKEGVIHSSLTKAKGENILLLEMDMGSAGAAFVKKLLNTMSTLNYFTRVEIG